MLVTVQTMNYLHSGRHGWRCEGVDEEARLGRAVS